MVYPACTISTRTGFTDARLKLTVIAHSDGNRSPVPTETDHLSEPATRDLRTCVDSAQADETLDPKAFDVPFGRNEAANLLRTVYGLT